MPSVRVLFQIGGMSRLSHDSLVSMALAILEEIAAEAEARPLERPRWLRFMLAWLFTISRGERAFFDNFWSSLASRDDMGRAQGVNASLNGIYRMLGRERA